MDTQLPAPPESLTGPACDFYRELCEMLDAVRPSRLDAGRSVVRFEPKAVDLDLVHSDRSDWVIGASVDEQEAIVGTGGAHEHFFPHSPEAPGERPWTTQAVDFVAEILRGEIEIETTLRGDTPIVMRHYNFDELGERNLLGHTGFLVPARLALWRPKRVERETVSFE